MLVDEDGVHRLVLRHGTGVVRAEVEHLVVRVQQVDVLVLIDDDEFRDRWVPGNMVNVSIAQLSHLVVGGDGLVAEIIAVKVVGSPHVESVAPFHYLLRLTVGHERLPGASLGVGD